MELTDVREFVLSVKNGDKANKMETKKMVVSEAARLNDIFELENVPMRWIDAETKQEYHLSIGEHEDQGLGIAPEPELSPVEAANQKILELFTERPLEFVGALQRMMGQAAYDVFMMWEQYRAAIHNHHVPKNLIINEPQRPEDLPIMWEMSAILSSVKVASEFDDILKVADSEGEADSNERKDH